MTLPLDRSVNTTASFLAWLKLNFEDRKAQGKSVAKASEIAPLYMSASAIGHTVVRVVGRLQGLG